MVLGKPEVMVAGFISQQLVSDKETRAVTVGQHGFSTRHGPGLVPRSIHASCYQRLMAIF